MTISDFVTKAIEGGWNSDTAKYVAPTITGVLVGDWQYDIHAVLLDPDAWRAVYGNDLVEWKREIEGDIVEMAVMAKWKVNMHRFVDYICEGKSIEEALISLETK